GPLGGGLPALFDRHGQHPVSGRRGQGVQVTRRVVAALVTLVALAATAGCGLLPGRHMTISAVFPDSTGLYLGNDVSVLGIKVGSVVAVHPQGTHVVVDMA